MMSLDCLQVIGEDCQPECTQEHGICDCARENASGSSFQEASWSNGADNTVNVDASPFRYCVRGDELTLEVQNYEGPYFMIYERR